jgi:hypothetical protein
MAYKRHAGKSTREMASQRRKSALWIAIIGIGILIVVALVVENAKALGIGGIGILALLVFMRIFGDFIEGQVNRKIKLEKRAIRGAKAEEKVGELLGELPDDEYYVLNDVESPYGNIDHIVIGKNCGIFLLETKAHGGKVETDGETLLVNGKLPEKDFVYQALQNSYWLRDKISEIVGSKPWITPVIVFTNAFVSPTKPIKGVYIVNTKYLLPLLRRTNKPNAVLAQIWKVKEKIDTELS